LDREHHLLHQSSYPTPLIERSETNASEFTSLAIRARRPAAPAPPKDIFGSDLLKLELQLDTYIDVMRYDDRFNGVENLVDLSVELVETNRHDVYDLVFLLLKMVLLL
jgi:hypothetical protein